MFDRLSRRARCAAALVLCHLALAAQAADEFAVTPAQIQALGVQLHRLQSAADADGPVYPARVVVPPRQDQVISAPMAGMVDQLLVAGNEAVRPGQALVRLASPEIGANVAVLY